MANSNSAPIRRPRRSESYGKWGRAKMILLRFLADLSFVIVLIFCCLFVGFIIARIVLAPAKREEQKREAKELAAKVEDHFIPISEPLPTDALDIKEARLKIKEYPITPKYEPVETSKKKSAGYQNVKYLFTEEEIYVLRVITAEGGTDPDTCNYVTQALYNACAKYNWKYSPYEMIFRYKYARPYSWYSEEALTAYKNVFLHGVRYPEIGNATIFYAPEYCISDYHESQILVLDHHGVKYFEERN